MPPLLAQLGRPNIGATWEVPPKGQNTTSTSPFQWIEWMQWKNRCRFYVFVFIYVILCSLQWVLQWVLMMYGVHKRIDHRLQICETTSCEHNGQEFMLGQHLAPLNVTFRCLREYDKQSACSDKSWALLRCERGIWKSRKPLGKNKRTKYVAMHWDACRQRATWCTPKGKFESFQTWQNRF